jgi:signal transduction histidine kinase/outer membrane murein-binding lipoprotein Lpp
VFRSLRFRLTALFLAGIVLAGLVASLIALRLFQDVTRTQSINELRREAQGLSQLYAESARRASDENRRAPDFAAAKLEAATGDRLFYVGLNPFPGEDTGLEPLSEAQIGRSLPTTRVTTFEFTLPGQNRTLLAAATPLRLAPNTPPFGWLVVAKPDTELRERWLTLFGRLALGLLGGLIVAGGLAWYLSRRISEPVLALSRAADEIAEGNYDTAVVPEVPGSSEIAHLAERFRQMAAKLSESQALERNFLMSVSHELRTPLTAIRGHVAALQEGVVTDPALAAESLAVVAAEADRLARLVGDVLDLAKLDAHRFTVLSEEVDMSRLVDTAYTAFAEEARRRAIDYRLDESAQPVIVSDGDRVLQIISNLLANAFRWTPDGGAIGVALGSANGTVMVDVQDTGPGIAADERERIFRPFFSHDAGGTGLGLPIARELAIALGGTIELDTRVGKGSRFRLVLPARYA